MPRGKAHSDEVKAQVMAALLAGQGVTQVADQYHLPKKTVQDWLRQVRSADSVKAELDEPEKRDRLAELIGGCLETFLTTIRIQAEQARDPEYIKKQPGSELAVLFGVIADKAFRILEAAESATERDPAKPVGIPTGGEAQSGTLEDSTAP